MTMRFDGRVAIVTGSGTGLGRNYALALAARGARVVVNDLAIGSAGTGEPSTAAQQTAEQIRSLGGEAIADGADVTRSDQVSKMIERAVSRWDRVDILVNNAGNLRDKTFAKMDLEDFRSVIEVHLMGAAHCSKAVWEIMRRQQYGRIVMISSSAGIYGSFGQTNYCAAKMSVIGLMLSLHLEGRKYGICVNALTPEAATPANIALAGDHIPKEHMDLLDPEAVSPALLFLVSELSPSRVVLSAGAGTYARVYVHETDGVWLAPAERTPERIAELFDKISDPTEQVALQDAYEQVTKQVRKAAEALSRLRA